MVAKKKRKENGKDKPAFITRLSLSFEISSDESADLDEDSLVTAERRNRVEPLNQLKDNIHHNFILLFRFIS